MRRVRPDGLITTVLGTGEEGYSNDGTPAARAKISFPTAVALGPDGSLYISDDNCIRRVKTALPEIGLDEIAIPSKDGEEVYIFDGLGRHRRTISALNGTIVYCFNYDETGRLVSVDDGDGNVTVIERDSEGIPTAIIAPGGQRTGLAIDTNGYLNGVTCPLGKTVTLEYDTEGLLTSLTDRKGNVYNFAYDDLGRLVRDKNPAGGYTVLERDELENGFEVSATTALGRVSTYRVEYLPTGETRYVNTNPSRAQIVSIMKPDGITNVTYPDGTTVSLVEGPDPRWGMQAPLVEDLTIITPEGLTSTTTETRVATYDPGNPGGIETLTYTLSINGRTYTTTFDAILNQIAVVTPEGRETVYTLDTRGRVVQAEVPGLDPVTYTYDEQGRLLEVRQGDRSITYAYDEQNRISRTDAAGNQVCYTYNDANLLTAVTLPSGRTYQFTYDENGNRTEVIMPSGAVHKLEYTVLNQGAGYTPPGNAGSATDYDLDRAPATVTLPSGRTINFTYDEGGRPVGVSYNEAEVALGYRDATSRIFGITRIPGDGGPEQTIAFDYDGSLVTRMTVGGIVYGEYAYRYDDSFNLTGITLDDLDETVLVRDNDGLLTGYGPFTITRDGPAGAASEVSDGKMTMILGYDGYGRLIDRTHTVDGEEVYRLQLAYDNIGHVEQKIETVAGTTHTYDYTYDVDGQLTEVRRDGAVVETYSYDVNGNRISNGDQSASYDEQDRIIRQGGVTYEFDSDGFLTRRGNDTFEYSARGELLQGYPGQRRRNHVRL
ncbi:MAG: hypothetical protein ACOYU7_05475 [Bacillota bacterium]